VYKRPLIEEKGLFSRWFMTVEVEVDKVCGSG